MQIHIRLHLLHFTSLRTYRTPIDDGLSGQAKNRIAGKYRDNPAFQDMMMLYSSSSIILTARSRQPYRYVQYMCC
jgi:hypothetical protein